MIPDLLERAHRRAEMADVVVKTDETLSLSFEAGRLKTTSYAQEEGTNLRVVSQGRMGFAGTTAQDPDTLLEAALASARVGETVALELPRPAPLPAVLTHVPRAAAATVSDLSGVGALVLDRLSRDGCQVSVAVERSMGSVRVANTRGADAEYDVTTVSVSAEVTRVRGDDVLIVSDHYAGADLPDSGELEAMVGTMLTRLDWAARTVESPRGSLPVLFSPAGSAVLFAPLQLAFLGKSVLQGVSPIGDRRGEVVFDPAFSLSDDPLLDGRAGSRPVDDEAVPCRRVPLIAAGEVSAFVYDLETAGRAETRSTGCARRSTFGKPQASYSNLVVDPGRHSDAELLGMIPDGLLIDELLGVGQGNVIGGAFSHPVALAFRVQGGEVVGRVKDAAVAGTVYELLKRIAGIGKDVRWRGSLATPAMVVEGVGVAGR